MDREKSYLIFVLGYDFLNAKLNDMECDLAFEKCEKIVDYFMESNEYLSCKCSSYEALDCWLRDNEIFVNKVMKGE